MFNSWPCAYIGVSVIRNAADLGTFIGAQDKIPWTQGLTQELGKLGGPNSYKASIALSSLFNMFECRQWYDQLAKCATYKDAVAATDDVISNGPFIAKNVVEVILNAVQFSTYPHKALPEFMKVLIKDYSFEPAAVYGPGPIAVFERWLGTDWTHADIEKIRRQLNSILRACSIRYQGRDQPMPHRVTGPQHQSIYCKMKGVIDDYSSATLSHARVQH